MSDKQYLEDRSMQPAQVHGTPMSNEAKGRAAIAAQVSELKQRAEVMKVSVAQLIQLQDSGQVQNPLLVPGEFRTYLSEQAKSQRAAMQNVQREAPHPPQVSLPPDHPLYQQALAAAQQQTQPPPQVQQPPQQQPQYAQPQQYAQPPQAASHVSEQIAPPAAPLYDQAAAAQLAQFGPPPSQAELASLDTLMGASDSGALMMGDEYESALQHVQQATPPPQKEPETPRTFDVEHMPPNAIPPKQTRPSAVTMLKNPVWRDVDSLLLWESFCSCVMEADSHMIRDPLQRKLLIQRLAKFQAAIEEQNSILALPYLKEIEKRARHRAMLTRRLTTLGVHPAKLTSMAQDYQRLLGSISEAIIMAVTPPVDAASLPHPIEPEKEMVAPKEQPPVAAEPELVEATPIHDETPVDGEPPAKES